MFPLCIMLRRQIPVYHGFIRLLPPESNLELIGRLFQTTILNNESLKLIAILSISRCRDASIFVLIRVREASKVRINYYITLTTLQYKLLLTSHRV